jgi:hypothetical protein
MSLKEARTSSRYQLQKYLQVCSEPVLKMTGEGEMAQTMYVHMNKQIKKRNLKKILKLKMTGESEY